MGVIRYGRMRHDDQWQGVTQQELGQAARNHGMQLEGLRYDVTPIGMHYLVIHFDIPAADETVVDGGGRRPRRSPVDALHGRHPRPAGRHRVP